MFTLEKVVPWGRSFDEYRRMFALTDADLRNRIVGCADGPASFNAELTAAGGSVISCDPLYALSADAIRSAIEETAPTMIEEARRNEETFVWSEDFPDPEALAHHRLATMEKFLADYEAGRIERRYVPAELPDLPFDDDSFDLALCSHFLFLYSEQLSEQFHLDATRGMLVVARETRVFPLMELGAKPSRHVGSVVSQLRAEGFHASIETVDYEFQRGGNQMMRILR